MKIICSFEDFGSCQIFMKVIRLLVLIYTGKQLGPQSDSHNLVNISNKRLFLYFSRIQKII